MRKLCEFFSSSFVGAILFLLLFVMAIVGFRYGYTEGLQGTASLGEFTGGLARTESVPFAIYTAMVILRSWAKR